MKLLFCGSFKFLDEMKGAEEKLTPFGFECILPRFSMGNFSSKEIEGIKDERKEKGLREGELEKISEVTKWFYDRLQECDAMIVFNKGGYIGLAASSEIGAAYILKKPVFFLEEPEDASMRAMIRIGDNFKVATIEELENKDLISKDN